MKEKHDNKDTQPKSWEPDAPTGEDALMDEERSLDIGESGQFAPGGYYNQQSVNKPKRTIGKWDDEIAPPGRH